MIRVVIIDDSIFMQKALTHLLQSDPEVTVVGTATDGGQGLLMVIEQKPDVVLLDLAMPHMDGLETLARIMWDCATPVLIVSGVDSSRVQAVKAMELGAVDFVAKPSGPISYDIDKVRGELLDKVKSAASVRMSRRTLPEPYLGSAVIGPTRKTVVVIGGSTGSAALLAQLMSELPQRFPAALVIVMHLGAEFLPALVQRWAWECSLPVSVARDDDVLTPGQILVCSGEQQFQIKTGAGGFRLVATTGGVRDRVIDWTMSEAARTFGTGAVGLVLSGMGQDGVQGMLAIKAAGGRTLAQDPDTCVVASMPAHAIAAGAVDRVIAPAHLAAALVVSL